MTIELTPSLPAATRAEILEMSAAANAFDGVAPLNEQAMLNLSDQSAQHAVLTAQEQIVGYAQLVNNEVQLVVHPDYRRQGNGRELVDFVQRHWQPDAWWSFGTLPAAAQLAKHLKLAPARQLLKMSRPLSDSIERPVFPDEFELTSYQNADLDALVDLNARTFADHPEQGQMDQSDAQRRMSQTWFDPADLLLLKSRTGELAGFHWLKIAPDQPDNGEVYVIAISPDHAGHGLGRKLLNAGLAHLQAKGVENVDLYVEAGNDAVVGLYERSGFGIINIDTRYSSPN